MLCLVVQKRQLDIFLTSRHHSWNNHPSLKFYRGYSHLCGVRLGQYDKRAAILIFCRLEVFIARGEVFLPSSYTKMRPYSPRDSGSQLPSFSCNYFIIRCRNLREPLQDLRARDFQLLSDFFSPNICVAKFRSILFLFLFCLLLLLHTKLFLFVVNGKPEFIRSNATDTIKI